MLNFLSIQEEHVTSNVWTLCKTCKNRQIWTFAQRPANPSLSLGWLAVDRRSWPRWFAWQYGRGTTEVVANECK